MTFGAWIVIAGWLGVLAIWAIMWFGADNSDARATGELVPIFFAAQWTVVTALWAAYRLVEWIVR